MTNLLSGLLRHLLAAIASASVLAVSATLILLAVTPQTQDKPARPAAEQGGAAGAAPGARKEGAKSAAPAAAAVDIPVPDIPYTRFTLKNGLTVLVHEDHKTPVVAVNTWYHVGSKNEKPGKTGFAHLFEHLMFSGSQ